MRTLQFLKNSMSVLCACVCFRGRSFSRTDKLNTSHCNKGIEFCENGQIVNDLQTDIDREILPKGPSSDSSASSDDVEEKVPLRREKGCDQQTLNLKHSTCLFCFANHPKSLVLSSVYESKSVEALKLIEDLPPKSDDIKNSDFCSHFDSYDTNTKRNSIHLSLEHLHGGTDPKWSCLHRTEDQAIKC